MPEVLEEVAGAQDDVLEEVMKVIEAKDADRAHATETLRTKHEEETTRMKDRHLAMLREVQLRTVTLLLPRMQQRNGFARWCRQVLARQRAEQTMSRCIGRWVRIQVVKAWNAWVRQTLGGGVEARRLQLCLASKAVVRMQQLAEARCFQRWCKTNSIDSVLPQPFAVQLAERVVLPLRRVAGGAHQLPRGQKCSARLAGLRWRWAVPCRDRGRLRHDVRHARPAV